MHHESFEQPFVAKAENLPEQETIPSAVVSPEDERQRLEELKLKSEERKKQDESNLAQLKAELSEILDNEDAATPDTKSKIESGRLEEISAAANVIAVNLDEFQQELKGNKFNRISFGAEGLKPSSGGFDHEKMITGLQDISKAMRKAFVPEDPEDRMSVTSKNFGTVIESLEALNGRFVSFRKNVEDGGALNAAESKTLADEISGVMSAIRKQKDSLDDFMTERKKLERRFG